MVERAGGAQVRRITAYLPPALARRLALFAIEHDLDKNRIIVQAVEAHLIATNTGLDPRAEVQGRPVGPTQIGGVPLPELPSPPRAGRAGPHRSPDVPVTERSYPPNEEVLELWGRCLPADQSPYVTAGLSDRALPAATVAQLDLGRALPPGGKLPSWARYQGQTWHQTGHHLLLPAYSDRGELCSLRAWGFRQDYPKRLTPAGHRAGGLILANEPGLHLLRTGAPPSPGLDPAPLRVVITEGEPDFLTWATRFPDPKAAAPVVLGVVSGSWTEAMASRIPNGTRVTIRTHHDEVGDRYAAAIYRTLVGRCTLLRSRATY